GNGGRGGTPLFDVGQDVFFTHTATRTGAGDLVQVDIVLASQAPGQRGDALSFFFVLALRSGCSLCFSCSIACACIALLDDRRSDLLRVFYGGGVGSRCG